MENGSPDRNPGVGDEGAYPDSPVDDGPVVAEDLVVRAEPPHDGAGGLDERDDQENCRSHEINSGEDGPEVVHAGVLQTSIEYGLMETYLFSEFSQLQSGNSVSLVAGHPNVREILYNVPGYEDTAARSIQEPVGDERDQGRNFLIVVRVVLLVSDRSVAVKHGDTVGDVTSGSEEQGTSDACHVVHALLYGQYVNFYSEFYLK